MAQSAILNVMTQAALKAGRRLTRDFGEVENLQISRKGPGDFVTSSDRKSEEILVQELQKSRPLFSILTEESGFIKGKDSQHRFIIDPIDGTTNFLHAIPVFAVSIALESQGKLMAGVVYNPIMEEMFTAERGKGAFLNDKRIRVGGRKSLGESAICCDLASPIKPHHGLSQKELKALLEKTPSLRIPGAASLDLAWTAAGRFDGYIDYGCKPWDIAAGMLLVREAGGLCTDERGSSDCLDSDYILAGNEYIQSSLLQLLKTTL